MHKISGFPLIVKTATMKVKNAIVGTISKTYPNVPGRITITVAFGSFQENAFISSRINIVDPTVAPEFTHLSSRFLKLLANNKKIWIPICKRCSLKTH